jgi:nucleotide-binding universal stress UspA family protein
MIALREMLCATDIERPALTALRYSFFIAEEFHASLCVVHAIGSSSEVPARDAASTNPSRDRRIERQTSERRLTERLDAVVRAVPTGVPGRASTRVVEGNVTRAVLKSAEQQRADLILLGSNPSSAFVWNALEPVAQQITRSTFCPVMTIPHHSGSSAFHVKRIVLPLGRVGYKDLATTQWAALIARRFGAVVELLQAGEGLDGWRHDVEDALRRAGVGVEVSRCGVGRTLADSVLSRIEQSRCDLLVMSVLSHDSARFSVVDNVRRQSVVPVLSVRAAGADRLFADDGFEDEEAEKRESWSVRQSARA